MLSMSVIQIVVLYFSDLLLLFQVQDSLVFTTFVLQLYSVRLVCVVICMKNKKMWRRRNVV